MGKIKKGSYWLVIFWMLFLTGCGSTELEERCFPMLVSVGYEEGKVTYDAGFPKEYMVMQPNARGVDFEESKKKFENRLNKETDYNHLKVLVFEDDFLGRATTYKSMLDYLAETESFPRNTYVCVVDDAEDLFEIENQVDQDLGTYLEEYLKKHEEKKDKLLTLGDLIDEKENIYFVSYLPYLEVEDNYIEWRGYMNTSGKSWK